jgi:hypothetical protein
MFYVRENWLGRFRERLTRAILQVPLQHAEAHHASSQLAYSKLPQLKLTSGQLQGPTDNWYFWL